MGGATGVQTMTAIKAISLDFGRVLGNFDKMIACTKIAAQCTTSAEEIYQQLVGSEGEKDLEVGKISASEFARNVIQRFDMTNASPEEVSAMWGDIVSPNPDIMPILHELVGKKLQLNVLSNTSSAHWRYVRQLPAIRLLEAHGAGFTLSYIVQAAKPEKKIFDAMLRSLDAHPDEVLFIDDIDVYVDAARVCRMNAEVYDCTIHNTAHLRAIFTKHGLL